MIILIIFCIPLIFAACGNPDVDLNMLNNNNTVPSAPVQKGIAESFNASGPYEHTQTLKRLDIKNISQKNFNNVVITLGFYSAPGNISGETNYKDRKLAFTYDAGAFLNFESGITYSYYVPATELNNIDRIEILSAKEIVF